MNPSPPTYRLFAGVDIAATTFAASWISADASPERAVTFVQTPDGFSSFQDRLLTLGVPPTEILVVIEATGAYWVALAVSLHQAGFAVAVINPAHAHNYVLSLPRRAKTDALDARLLAQFASERHPPRWSPPEHVYHQLRQRLLVRDGLVTMRTQARNQHHARSQWPVQIAGALDQLEAVIAKLDKRITMLEDELATVLRDGAWAEAAALLDTITGIGLITTAWLLVGTLNFQACSSAEQAAPYVGLVPFARETGSSGRGRAHIGHGGQSRLRTALYLASLSAARFNPHIKAHYERLRAAGTPSKVARCAAARKLLQLAYAVVTKHQAFDPLYAGTRQKEQTRAM
jgi:transposase